MVTENNEGKRTRPLCDDCVRHAPRFLPPGAATAAAPLATTPGAWRRPSGRRPALRRGPAHAARSLVWSGAGQLRSIRGTNTAVR